MSKYFLSAALSFIICHLSFSPVGAQTSVAGLFPLENSGRVIYNFNEGWHFCLGDAENAHSIGFDDSRWPVVCAPHTVQLVPAEASGGRNYQGVYWYRKHFVVPIDMHDKEVIVHFEAIMGKQEIFVNGQLVTTNEGGYLPVIVNLSELGVHAGDSCLIAVKADNSDDKSYPPGKKQAQLDFAYHGGMYRDVWLIGRSNVHITDPLENCHGLTRFDTEDEDKGLGLIRFDMEGGDKGHVPGGGVFLHYDNISEKSADVFIDVEVRPSLNPSLQGRGAITCEVEAKIKDAEGKLEKSLKQKLSLEEGQYKTARLHTTIKKPHLWSPEDPYLYTVELKVTSPLPHREGLGVGLDGGIVRMGIRKAEFRGKDGFWLNGKPYHQLVGANRHQDFAYVGNAVPNSQQWRDAKRLKDAGFTIVRAAHYPQDPAFMDACDELGLFVIVPTPGWQYWNKAEGWAEKVHDNTRRIIRRDRNHPCVLMWEPILNETRYPKDFALKALQITREEFPYPGRPVAAADMNSEGVKDNYDVLYDWADNIKANAPPSSPGGDTIDLKSNEAPSGAVGGASCIFTREWGEYVDDWYAHNAINRACRAWGEHAQLTQALSLVDTYGMMFRGQRQFIGGCQWHPFDHQRGYHPDAYFGGLYDAFRQKKYAFEAIRLQSNQPPLPWEGGGGGSAGSVFIAHEMTQSSPQDVTVFSNCDSVRLIALNGWKTATLPVVHDPQGIPNAPVVFKGFWDFWQARSLSYTQRRWQDVKLVAEGIVGGEVVCREEKMPARRSTKLRLYADEMGKKLVADGSDFIVVVAEVTDDEGHVRRQAREHVTFIVEGEGTIIGNGLHRTSSGSGLQQTFSGNGQQLTDIMANPRVVEWGSAPILVRSTHHAGKIRIIARPAFEGIHTPTADTLTIESIPASFPECYDTTKDDSLPMQGVIMRGASGGAASEAERRRLLEEVERQQQDFGIQQ